MGRNKGNYDIVNHLGKWIVKCNITSNNAVYRDLDPLWVRSKNHLNGTSKKNCYAIIDECIAADNKSYRMLK